MYRLYYTLSSKFIALYYSLSSKCIAPYYSLAVNLPELHIPYFI
jgi:hypothetical protein